MAILHLMVGLPCSGKTSWAKQIEIASGAIRFTPDEWQTRLNGNDMHDPDHDRLHAEIEAIMGELADRLMLQGVDVILDFGFWSRAERDILKQHAAALGVECLIHYAEASRAVLEQRRQQRTASGAPDIFPFTAETLDLWIGQFEPPEGGELAAAEVRVAGA